MKSITVRYICHSCEEDILVTLPLKDFEDNIVSAECQNCGIFIELEVLSVD